MYKGLLGDCFLLKLSQGAKRTTILIDCGILLGIPGAKERMRKIAEDIVAEAGAAGGAKPVLDLVVVTHEHWDHVSGFAQASSILLDPAKLGIDRLWLAWTERDGDPQAARLRNRFEKRKKAVALVAGAMAGAGANPFAAAPGGSDAGLHAFVGPVDQAGALSFGATLTGREVLKTLKANAGKVDYLEPGSVVATPGGVNLRTYVLGPPRNEDRLFHDLPSKGERKETYFANRDLNEKTILALTDDAGTDLSGGSPFSKRHRMLRAPDVASFTPGPDCAAPGSAAAAGAWLQEHYYAPVARCRFGKAPPADHDCGNDLVCGSDQTRRRIDGDWLSAAGAVALKLDSDTNNTSLVLAFELPNRDILLFAADAQVGNWLSWYDQTYVVDGVNVTAQDILSRTVLYKVGHHGSHNATLRKMGLEAMTHPRLAAMISTVEADAKRQGSKGWKMPFAELKAELIDRTAGRILRGDALKGTDADGSRLTDEVAFLSRVREEPGGLWVEYELAG